MKTFNIDQRWIAQEGDILAFGSTELEAMLAVRNPQAEEYEPLVIRLESNEWELIVGLVSSLEKLEEVIIDASVITPASFNQGSALYATLSPAGRKYGTWSIMRQSSRNAANWEIIMPDVGSVETANRLVSILNSQNINVGSRLVAPSNGNV